MKNCELILISEEVKPIKILKKMVANTGAVRYLVEYSNNEQKQETEKFMKENYIELVEDYNYFSVCGCRYDQQTLQQIKMNKQKIQNFEAHAKLPQLPNEENYPIFKRQKKIEKSAEKIINNPIQKENINITQSSKALIENQILTHTQLTQQKSEPGDLIQQVQLENGIFSVQWKPRTDGTIPYQEFYHYDYLKATAPNLLLQFIEQEFLDKDPKFKQIKRQAIANKVSLSLETIDSESSQPIQISRADSVGKDKENVQTSTYKNSGEKKIHQIEENKDSRDQKNDSQKEQKDQEQKEQLKEQKELKQLKEQKEQKELKDQKELQKEQKDQKEPQKEQKEQKQQKVINEPKEQQKQQKEQKDAQKDPQKEASKNIIIDDISIEQEVIFDSKATAEKEKQTIKKRGIVPTIKPSGMLGNGQKLKKVPDKDNNEQTTKQIEKQQEKPIPKQQVTISQPNLQNQKITQNTIIEDLEILSLDKGDEKDTKNYEKQLEECYSDVEMPQFSFAAIEN